MEKENSKITTIPEDSASVQVLTDLRQLTINSNGGRPMVYIVNSIVNTYSLLPFPSPNALKLPLPIKIAANIRLIFEGGQLACPSSYTELILEGNHTSIKASPVQLFDGNIEIKGTWDIDRIYLQWFDERAGKDPIDSTDYHDCSSAISNVASMQGAGEVFLSKGCYFIARPIKLPYAVKLIGEGPSSVIIPYLTNTKIWPGKAFVEININENAGGNDPDWETTYPRSFGMMSDICFYNRRKSAADFPITEEEESEILSKVTCCYVAGSYSFQNLEFNGFRSCIKWSGNCYSDLKYVRNCSFHNDSKFITEDMGAETFYAIDTGYLGDAMVIERCHAQGISVSDDGKERVTLFNSLQAGLCQGGSIVNNIFNSDVYLSGCIGVVFQANHLGNGANLTLCGCDAAVRSNYFDKIEDPSIVVSMGSLQSEPKYYEKSKNSNLEISGNVFMVFRPLVEKSKDAEKTGENYEDYRDRFPAQDLCQYDIALEETKNEQTETTYFTPYNIHLSQNYRYVSFDSRSNQPTGIMLCTFNRFKPTEDLYVPFNDFNRRSYYLSTESTILPGLKIRAICDFEKLPVIKTSTQQGSTVRVFPTNAILNSSQEELDAPAINNGWRYIYSANLIMDVQRNISSGSANVEVFYATGNLQHYDPHYGQVFVVDYVPEGSCCILKLTRFGLTVDENNTVWIKAAAVEIPVIGTTYLYDNNHSVNGYKWNSLARTSDIRETGGLDGSWLGFKNDTVRYFLKNEILPAVSGWEEHDEVITPSGEVYLLLGGDWIKI